MIIGLQGSVMMRHIGEIHLNVQGVIYQVFISKNTQATIQNQEQITLHIAHIIKENQQTLYGFYDPSEKQIFDRLIKISGVGAKIALEICSSFTPKSFFDMVQNHDVNALKKVSGIGPKSAGKILVELSGFSVDILQEPSSENAFYSDAITALENLGFHRKEIQTALNGCVHNNDLASLIKEALQKLGKK